MTHSGGLSHPTDGFPFDNLAQLRADSLLDLSTLTSCCDGTACKRPRWEVFCKKLASRG